jgi:hypothetical protein
MAIKSDPPQGTQCGHLKAASQGKIRNKIWFEKEILISPV